MASISHRNIPNMVSQLNERVMNDLTNAMYFESNIPTIRNEYETHLSRVNETARQWPSWMSQLKDIQFSDNLSKDGNLYSVHQLQTLVDIIGQRLALIKVDVLPISPVVSPPKPFVISKGKQPPAPAPAPSNEPRTRESARLMTEIDNSKKRVAAFNIDAFIDALVRSYSTDVLTVGKDILPIQSIPDVTRVIQRAASRGKDIAAQKVVDKLDELKKDIHAHYTQVINTYQSWLANVTQILNEKVSTMVNVLNKRDYASAQQSVFRTLLKSLTTYFGIDFDITIEEPTDAYSEALARYMSACAESESTERRELLISILMEHFPALAESIGYEKIWAMRQSELCDLLSEQFGVAY